MTNQLLVNLSQQLEVFVFFSWSVLNFQLCNHYTKTFLIVILLVHTLFMLCLLFISWFYSKYTVVFWLATNHQKSQKKNPTSLTNLCSQRLLGQNGSWSHPQSDPAAGRCTAGTECLRDLGAHVQAHRRDVHPPHLKRRLGCPPLLVPRYGSHCAAPLCCGAGQLCDVRRPSLPEVDDWEAGSGVAFPLGFFQRRRDHSLPRVSGRDRVGDQPGNWEGGSEIRNPWAGGAIYCISGSRWLSPQFIRQCRLHAG